MCNCVYRHTRDIVQLYYKIHWTWTWPICWTTINLMHLWNTVINSLLNCLNNDWEPMGAKICGRHCKLLLMENFWVRYVNSYKEHWCVSQKLGVGRWGCRWFFLPTTGKLRDFERNWSWKFRLSIWELLWMKNLTGTAILITGCRKPLLLSRNDEGR
jgi:hypothetical protein